MVHPVVALASALALASLGGGLYEHAVVDPAWPKQPALVQPARGGISRKRFWIPAHVAFEVALVASLVLAWSAPSVRMPLLIGVASHAAMRVWSAFDFIPKALALERTPPERIDEDVAQAWVRRSRLRFPLDLVTCGAMLSAFTASARIT